MKLTVFAFVWSAALSLLVADEPGTRLELTEALSYEDYTIGKLITFHGHSDDPFLRPDIKDFRLERLSPGMASVPMIFGREWDLQWPADKEMKNVHLYLKCPGADDHALQDEKGIQLFAQTWIEPNARYRLTWSRRHPERRAAQLQHIEFQLKGEMEDDKERRAPFRRAYLCEVVYEDDGVQFLGRTVRPDFVRHPEMPAIGFTEHGQPVDPPDPGYKRVKRLPEAVGEFDHAKPKPPPAMTTHHVGMSLEDNRVTVRVSDIATSGRLPREPGKPTFVKFSGHLYRIELLTNNIERLRQDHNFWKLRTKQIRDEWAKRTPK